MIKVRKLLEKYSKTVGIAGIFLLLFVTDTIVRFLNGANFMEYIVGNHASGGIQVLICFNAQKILQGELWRIFTWPFFSEGFLCFVAEFVILGLLCVSLEQRISTSKILKTYLGLDIGITVAAIICNSDLKNNIHFAPDMSGMNFMNFAMAGVLYTLLFTKGKDDSKKNYAKFYARIPVLAYLIIQFIWRYTTGGDIFVCIYVFSLGMLAGLILSFYNQNIIAVKINGKFKELPPMTRIKVRDCRVTITIMTICIVSFLLNCVIVDKNLLIKIYGNLSASAWIDYVLNGGENGYVARWLLMKPDMVRQGEIWRLVSYVFSHTGLIHLMTNMLVLYFSGKYVESKVGTFKMLLIYLGSTVTVSLFCIVQGIYQGAYSGSSLGLYALMTMFLLYSFKEGNNIRSHFYEILYVVGYFIMANTPMIGFCGNYHMISFLVGFVSAWMLSQTTSISQ